MSESEAMEEEPDESGIASLSLGYGREEGAVGGSEVGWQGESSSTHNLPTPSDISSQDGQVMERLHALEKENREYKEQLQVQREQLQEQTERNQELQRRLEDLSVQPLPGVLLYVDPAFVSGGRGQATVTHQEVSDCLMRDAKFYRHFCQRVDPALLVPSLGLPTGQEEFVMNLSMYINKETANQFLWRYLRLESGWPERLASALKERPGTTDLGNKVEEAIRSPAKQGPKHGETIQGRLPSDPQHLDNGMPFLDVSGLLGPRNPSASSSQNGVSTAAQQAPVRAVGDAFADNAKLFRIRKLVEANLKPEDIRDMFHLLPDCSDREPQNADELLTMMKRSRLLSPYDVIFLQASLWTVGRKDLFKQVADLVKKIYGIRTNQRKIAHLDVPSLEPINGYEYVDFHIHTAHERLSEDLTALRNQLMDVLNVPEEFFKYINIVSGRIVQSILVVIAMPTFVSHYLLDHFYRPDVQQTLADLHVDYVIFHHQTCEMSVPSSPSAAEEAQSKDPCETERPQDLLNPALELSSCIMLSPKFLHSNSTSHTWAFSAIAELIDNAYDPDVSASELRIDVEEISGQTCLTFVDDGEGLDPDKLLKMLSFGFCEKDQFDDKKGFRAPIGFYGNGFKSGSMRLGKDAMVLTLQKTSNSMSVGLLSQTYLAAIGAETVLVPMVTWKLPERQTEGDAEKVQNNMEDILGHSVFRTEEELLKEFDKLQELKQSTKIIIYNLHTLQNGATELDLVSDPSNIRCSESQNFDRTTTDRSITTAPEYRKSLREYCSILFLKPRMKIYVRGSKVQTRLIRKSLSRTEIDKYKPSWLKKRVIITFGFSCSQRHEEEHGVMMYHRNRLIKAYEKVGYQRQSSDQGVGVVGVVEADFLRPIHNKQDFEKDEKYNSLIQALGNKLNDYWNEMTHSNLDYDNPSRQDPWTWAQCDHCLKWRRLPDGISGDSLPEVWFCYMNPDATHNRCDVEEDPESEDETLSRPTYKKTYKRELKRKMSLTRTRKELEQVQKERELMETQRQLREKNKRLEEKEERLRRQEEERQQQQQEQQQQKQQQQQQQRQERQQRRQQQQEESHHSDDATEDSARKISTMQEKLREFRQHKEEQKRRILAVEQQKTSLEQARKRAEKLVQGIRVQGGDTFSPSTSGERKKSLEKIRKELKQVQKERELMETQRQLRETNRRLEEKDERLRRQQEERQQQQRQERQQRRQQQQEESHHSDDAAEDFARKISTLQEKLRESRQREEEQKRRILAVEQQKTSLEQARKRAEKLVQGIRVVPVQGGDTPSPSTSGEPARKRFLLTHERGETIVAFSQSSSQPANVVNIGANMTGDNEMEDDQPMPAQIDLTLPDSPYNSSNDGRNSRSSRRRGTGNDSTVMEGQAAEIRALRLKLKNTEEEIAAARKQAENTEKELAEARKQAENTEKELAEARKQAENTEKELAEARKQAENSEKKLAETRKQAENTEKELERGEKAQVNLMTLRGHVHKLLEIIFPDMDIGRPETVDATVAKIIQLEEEAESSQ